MTALPADIRRESGNFARRNGDGKHHTVGADPCVRLSFCTLKKEDKHPQSKCDRRTFAIKKKKEYMSRTQEEMNDVSLLGNHNTDYDFDYRPEVLETFLNKHPENEYVVTFDCPEFTSLCPITGQPDFARIIINYIPRMKMVESKSLKLYLFSFRNHGDFHEDCINIIKNDLVKLMDPKYLEVIGLFTPRGGIAICPFANYADDHHQALAEERRLAAFDLALKKGGKR